MKVTINELEAQLTSLLAAVRRGETVEVLDGNTPIAHLVPIEEGRGFRVEPASRPLADLRTLQRVQLRRRVDLDSLLQESRSQRFS